MKKILITIISCLLSVVSYSQVSFVTYKAVPRPNIYIPKSNSNTFKHRVQAVPNIKVNSSKIVTTKALCVQMEGESFSIETKLMVKDLSNGITTLGLIAIKQGDKWNSLDEIELISIAQAITQATSKEDKDALLNISEFSYLAVLGENCMLLFK